jgi:hypothetical protein
MEVIARRLRILEYAFVEFRCNVELAKKLRLSADNLKPSHESSQKWVGEV